VGQLEELTALYKDYQEDPKFDNLRHESIKFVPGSGPINPTLMLVGEAPGRLENAKGECFVGRAGDILNGLLQGIGINRSEVFVTNVIKYWPIDFTTGTFNSTRQLSEEEIEAARDYLTHEIDIIQPKIVGLCGGFATRSIFPDLKTVYHYNGKLLDDMFVPLYHPAVLSYTQSMRKWPAVRKGYNRLGDLLKTAS